MKMNFEEVSIPKGAIMRLELDRARNRKAVSIPKGAIMSEQRRGIGACNRMFQFQKVRL